MFTDSEMAAVRAVMPHADDWTIRRHLEQRAAIVARTGRAPRFLATYCSQCGGDLGPGESGVSHCSDHLKAK